MVAFDLLYLNGYDLRKSPLVERKAHLKKLIARTAIQYSESFEIDGPEIYKHACTTNNMLDRLKKAAVAKGPAQSDGVGNIYRRDFIRVLRFFNPIILPGRKPLVTLRDAALTSLSCRMAERDSSMMFARIGVMLTQNRRGPKAISAPGRQRVKANRIAR
jgi:hypothetical protein